MLRTLNYSHVRGCEVLESLILSAEASQYISYCCKTLTYPKTLVQHRGRLLLAGDFKLTASLDLLGVVI